MADIASFLSEDSSFDVTIDDTSPTIVYAPFVDGIDATSPAGGWTSCYSLAGEPVCNSSLGEDNTTATSLHATTADGASLAVQWNGTAISLYGYFPADNPTFPSALSYSVTLDGTSTTNYASALGSGNISQDVLASFTNLTNDEHRIELVMHNTAGLTGSHAQLLFDRALITSVARSSARQSNSAVATQLFPDGAISFHGQWSFERDLLSGQNLSFHSSTNVGDSASFDFNGTAITLSGLTTPLSGGYNVSLDNETPQTLSARSTYNSSTILFFRTGLDPATLHHLSIVNLGASAEGEGTLLAVGSVDVTNVAQNNSGATPVPVMSSKSLSHGAIAGIAVGSAVAAIALLSVVAFFIYRRRQVVQRKQQLIVNPRMSMFRRLSFLPKARQSRNLDAEKERESAAPDMRYSNPILDIAGGKDDEDGTEENDLRIHDAGAGSRHASQNSDGSYSVSLPELPNQGGTARTRSNEVTPPLIRPIMSAVVRNSQASQSSPAPQPPPPRSPKPRGPRDMHISVHGRNGSQGILLKEMYSPTADVPVDVREGDVDNDRSFLPAPDVSPLRVNFEEELAGHAERKRGRFRSGVSGISLPQSLRQAFSRGHDPHHHSTSQATTSETGPQQDRRYSFLDMESTRSNSVSAGTPSTRPSRTTSTRSSSNSQRRADDSEWSAPGKNAVPPLPHRASMGVSMTIAGGPTSSRPSLSPDISLQAVPLPHVTVSDEANAQSPQDVPESAHPNELPEFLPSPTESIPMTVSDIHFRHSSHSSISFVSPRPSDDLDNPPQTPHPPLPRSVSAEPPEQRPYIVQRLLGRHGAGSAPSTPYSSPTARSFRPSGPRTSIRRGSWVGPSFSSAMNTPRQSGS